MAFERPTREQLAAATPEERAALTADCLSLFEPSGRYPLNVYDQLRRLMMRTTVEIVPLRFTSEGPEVLLGQRAVNPEDKLSGLVNLPGAGIAINEPRQHYRDFATAADRILRGELKGSVIRTSDFRIFDFGWPDGVPTREHKMWGVTTVDLAEGHETPINGAFYGVSEVVFDPPANLVEGHAVTFLRGLEAFSQLHQIQKA